MIIDTHAHIGALPPFFDMTTEQVLYSMDKYGIDFSLISSIEAAENDHEGNPVPAFLQKPQNVILKDTLEAVKKAPDKLGALPWLKIGSELPDSEFIRIIKMKRGKSLLDQGRTNVSEVANMVGLSAKQFAHYFKQMYDVTPSDYLRNIGNSKRYKR